MLELELCGVIEVVLEVEELGGPPEFVRIEAV
jgi:hypothetical protein